MNKLTGAVAVVAILTVTIGSSAGAATWQKTAAAAKKADTVCNTAIASGKVVTAKVLKACNNPMNHVPSSYVCTTGPKVWEISVGSNDSALLRVGYKPAVYSEQNFYLSETDLLCGQSIPAGLTTPQPPLTQNQVKRALKK
jgi:hypothetical protein